jgi:hypothetical protein
LNKLEPNQKITPLKLHKIILKKLLANFGSKNIINIPTKEVKTNIHFFELIFSFSMIELARTPKGIASCDPTITGDIIDE